MKLVVGLGNIGKEYLNTRHNIGFSTIDKYLCNIKWSKHLYGSYYKNNNVIFLKPNTYMNLSGKSLKYFVDYFKIPIENILVIHDDLNLLLGSYKLKKDSSSGGHNGIKSIIDYLGTKEFLRLKIGINYVDNKNDSVNFVLGKFSKEELSKNVDKQPTYNNIIADFILGLSSEELMNKYN
ncbi:MAG: aminoacyl-tRNA hydrolase [Bacilli bacterium]|nr:aminoacyl-tRNA hydrolase [Bacilli bacterium]